jgi:sortase A
VDAIARDARAGRIDFRPALRRLATAVIAAGVLLLIDAGVTLVWQEPLTALLASGRQSAARRQFLHLPATGTLSPAASAALASLHDQRQRMAFLARRLERSAADGSGVGRIVIPRIGDDFAVVKGTSAADLRRGPGFYDWAGLPGEPRAVAIAGHRTTYLAPFRHIDELRRGDAIRVDMPYGRFVYTVASHAIVAPTDVGVVTHRHAGELVLSACHPLYSAAQRYIVLARLRSVTPA